MSEASPYWTLIQIFDGFSQPPLSGTMNAGSVHGKQLLRGRARCVHAWRVLAGCERHRSTDAGRSRVVSDARATIQRHVRWVACTESSYGEGGRDVCMRGECRRDAHITFSTDAGRSRVVFDARAPTRSAWQGTVHRKQLCRWRAPWGNAWRVQAWCARGVSDVAVTVQRRMR
jgi:hypothetical protein